MWKYSITLIIPNFWWPWDLINWYIQFDKNTLMIIIAWKCQEQSLWQLWYQNYVSDVCIEKCLRASYCIPGGTDLYGQPSMWKQMQSHGSQNQNCVCECANQITLSFYFLFNILIRQKNCNYSAVNIDQDIVIWQHLTTIGQNMTVWGLNFSFSSFFFFFCCLCFCFLFFIFFKLHMLSKWDTLNSNQLDNWLDIQLIIAKEASD